MTGMTSKIEINARLQELSKADGFPDKSVFPFISSLLSENNCGKIFELTDLETNNDVINIEDELVLDYVWLYRATDQPNHLSRALHSMGILHTCNKY
ncbi:hypothetical protein MKW98_013685 [Papaver atlanticum]|uniref:Uncharacterized protein n=1 Tax=Papaver atlanticum TaxID=357466 RepID=A0AAD4SFM7_9MAGN|nr:hypothetical protein MKW98_013685 [Papaver atlanticum]